MPRRANPIVAVLLALPFVSLAGGGADPRVGELVKQLTREARWHRVAAIPLAFDAYHPQGMVKIGDTFYVSSVEILTPTRRYAEPLDGYDRDVGEGRAHLFKLDATGRLLADLPLGEGSIYHPGGIDYDGVAIWVPVAEYRPNSRSIVYRVDPATMKPDEVFRYADHLGAIVHDTNAGTLHGVAWGSRRFYRWALDRRGKVTNGQVPPARLGTPNPSHYVDYQDCKFIGRGQMLCGGLAEFRNAGGLAWSLGGIEIVDLARGRAVYQVPVELWTDAGQSMTRNAFWIERSGRALRAWFLPEDGHATIYVYEV